MYSNRLRSWTELEEEEEKLSRAYGIFWPFAGNLNPRVKSYQR